MTERAHTPTSAVYVVGQVFQTVTVTVMETRPMPSVYAVAIAQPTPTMTAFVTTSTIAWGRWMPVAFATALAPCTTVVAPTFRRALVTAAET